jgi:hypothetical protein
MSARAFTMGFIALLIAGSTILAEYGQASLEVEPKLERKRKVFLRMEELSWDAKYMGGWYPIRIVTVFDDGAFSVTNLDFSDPDVTIGSGNGKCPLDILDAIRLDLKTMGEFFEIRDGTLTYRYLFTNTNVEHTPGIRRLFCVLHRMEIFLREF